MFGERLCELRLKRKIAMKGIGNKFGVAESTIYGYENRACKSDLNTIANQA
jgi:transcriptional regulator with XRE-family HTH domain